MRAALLVALALFLAPGLSAAQQTQADDPKPGPSSLAGIVPTKELPSFKALDLDNNRSISRSEAAARPELEKHFERADRNADGKLSRSEYRELGRYLSVDK